MCDLAGNVPMGLLLVISWGGSILGFWQAPLIAILIVILSVIGVVRSGEVDAVHGVLGCLMFAMLFGFLYPALWIFGM